MEPPADWDIKGPGAEEKAERGRLWWEAWWSNEGGLWLMRVTVIKD